MAGGGARRTGFTPQLETEDCPRLSALCLSWRIACVTQSFKDHIDIRRISLCQLHKGCLRRLIDGSLILICPKPTTTVIYTKPLIVHYPKRGLSVPSSLQLGSKAGGCKNRLSDENKSVSTRNIPLLFTYRYPSRAPVPYGRHNERISFEPDRKLRTLLPLCPSGCSAPRRIQRHNLALVPKGRISCWGKAERGVHPLAARGN